MLPDGYRYYRLDGAGMIYDAEWFEAQDDAAATARIAANHPDATCEIWLGKRLVAKTTPWVDRLSSYPVFSLAAVSVE